MVVIICYSLCARCYSYIPPTDQLSRAHSVAAVLWLQFVVLVCCFNFHIITFRKMRAVLDMLVFCSSLMSCCPGMLLWYYYYYCCCYNNICNFLWTNTSFYREEPRNQLYKRLVGFRRHEALLSTGATGYIHYSVCAGKWTLFFRHVVNCCTEWAVRLNLRKNYIITWESYVTWTSLDTVRVTNMVSDCCRVTCPILVLLLPPLKEVMKKGAKISL